MTPNLACQISSWAYDAAVGSGLTGLVDNRALDVACYNPGYTLVEKLQTISTKYRQQQASFAMPRNFMRHYYDVYCLLGDPQVQALIGTVEYLAHKDRRFPAADEKDITKNEAFALSDPSTRELYESAYSSTSALYYRGQPPFKDLIERIQANAKRL